MEQNPSVDLVLPDIGNGSPRLGGSQEEDVEPGDGDGHRVCVGGRLGALVGTLEVVIVTGEEGRQLRMAQAGALADLLVWARDQQTKPTLEKVRYE